MKLQKMKRLSDLTRNQRYEYILSFEHKNDKHKIDDAEIQYLFENNTNEEIRKWLETKASTISFKGADLFSVYMYNCIAERLNDSLK